MMLPNEKQIRLLKKSKFLADEAKEYIDLIINGQMPADDVGLKIAAATLLEAVEEIKDARNSRNQTEDAEE